MEPHSQLVIAENPYGGSVIYDTWVADMDEDAACLVAEWWTAFYEEEGTYSAHGTVAVLVRHADSKPYGEVRQMLQESVDEKIHEVYRSLHGSSVLEGLDTNGDQDDEEGRTE